MLSKISAEDLSKAVLHDVQTTAARLNAEGSGEYLLDAFSVSVVEKVVLIRVTEMRQRGDGSPVPLGTIEKTWGKHRLISDLIEGLPEDSVLHGQGFDIDFNEKYFAPPPSTATFTFTFTPKE